ncbi:bacillithiol system redox-active protein YtxJ [Longirhabdus pacifica]|uniref:bacillithiol system redox-active protein YtxJ n=1 Tax=Longirhabdus pacifica TaxID=2305227 RepID=UPI001F0C45AB|nr:bacillithiol system redox-active protein YtxJ [Longirhabdus pacifica]
MWKEITSKEQWEQVLQDSKEHSTIVFKHSTACPISAQALKEYEQFLSENPPTHVQYTLVKVIETREVSNQIAADLDVKHESPQVILLENQEAAWNDSHRQITVSNIQSALVEK